ncbi:MAG: hypothetical protein NUW22_12330 [Acidobacteria bacterium]|nr:hypothetical protein [Acidobacteriota bacterium]
MAMSFSAQEIAEAYELDLHAHDVPVIMQFLAERQGHDLHVIARVDTPDPQGLLPGISAYDMATVHREHVEPVPCVVDVPDRQLALPWDAAIRH